jgi:hypothetical protein
MDTKSIDEREMLVNFRAPKDVIETLDQLSRFHHRSRTSIMLDLITSWINEKTIDIPFKVRQLKDLKTALNSHEEPTLVMSPSMHAGEPRKSSQRRSELIPTSFISTSSYNNSESSNF